MTMLTSHLMDQAAGWLLTAFVAGLWQGAALTLLAAALLKLMPRSSAGLRHTLLIVTFATALLLPFARFNAAHAVHGTVSHALPVASWVAAAIACLWILSAGARGVQLASAWSHLRTVRRRATPILLDGVAAFSAGNRQAKMCVSADVDSPTILGFLHPALLLPEWMAPTLSPDELRQIALHECEHLRRRDDWLNLLLQLGLVVSPLNPGLVWLNRRIGVQRELACDDAVVASTGQPIAYASCLARLAEQRLQQRGRLRLALAAWERKSELAQRIHTLLQRPSRWTATQSAGASAAAAALLLTASVGLARAPQFVRIVTPASTVDRSEPALVAAASVVTASRHMTATAPLQMLPVSYSVASSPAFHTRPETPKRAAQRKPAPAVPARQRMVPLAQPQMLRTSAQVSTEHQTNATFDDRTPVRFVTAEFSPSYVAVPTANGWLLIEL